MKKISLLALFLGFNIALGACSDDDSAPVVKNESFQLPAKAYVLAEQTRRAIVIRDGVGILIPLVFLQHIRIGLLIRVK